MKTKTYFKAATAAITLFFSVSANCQSEQETLTWLSEKLSAYLKPHTGVYGGVGFTNLKIISLEPCAITISFEQKHLMKNKLFCTMTLVIPTEGVVISDRGILQYSGDVIHYSTVSNSPNAVAKTKQLNTTPDIFIKEEEVGLIPKIQQAMLRASTYCTKNTVAQDPK